MEFLQAMLASLVPRKRRKWQCSGSGDLLTHAAVASGVLEFGAFAYLEFLQFRTHFVAVADHFAQGNETSQSAALMVVVASEFFYPISLFFILLSGEGLLRAISAAIVAEVVPSFPVAIASWLWDRSRDHTQRAPIIRG